MADKRVIFTSITLTILFFIAGLLVTPLIMETMNQYFIGLNKEILIANTTISQQFKIHLFTALSFALLPVLVLIIGLLLPKLKYKSITTWNYFFYLLILITIYCMAAALKFYAFKFSIEKVLNFKVDPNLTNTLYLNQIKIYDWPLYASLIASVVMVLVIKKNPKF
jgi:hypothetical protein